MIVWHGPENSPTLVVLAPGDECRLSDTTPTAIANRLAEGGSRVARFAFPPCDIDDGTIRDKLVAELIRKAASFRTPDQHLVLGGLSRGARVSVTLAEELNAAAVLGFAYPFHGRTDPNPGDRVTQLASLSVPILICQGTRDSRGNKQQVRGYHLPEHIQIHWLEDANHALEPRPQSGQLQSEQLTEAATVATTFLNQLR